MTDFCLFIYLWLCWVFVAARAFLWLWQEGATLQLWCEGFSLQFLLLLWSVGSRARGLQYPGTWTHYCGAQALEHRLSCGAWPQLLLRIQDLSGPGTEPGSPALAGRFFTTEVPRKPLTLLLKILPSTSLNISPIILNPRSAYAYNF